MVHTFLVSRRGQVLHRSATTTEAIRRAIQHSQESLRSLARRHGINPKTVAKCKKRESAVDRRTGPSVPKSTVLTVEQEAILVAFRRHTLLPLDDCLYALQATIPRLIRSSLHRCLERHGISRLPEVEGDKPRIQTAPDDRVATLVVATVLPTFGKLAMALLIMVSTFGTVNALTLAVARACYAMAQDGLFFRRAGILNQSRVPGWAPGLQCLWSLFLVLPRTYDQATGRYGNLYSNLLDYVISAALLFYILMVAGLFRLRRTRPNHREWDSCVLLPAMEVETRAYRVVLPFAAFRNCLLTRRQNGSVS